MLILTYLHLLKKYAITPHSRMSYAALFLVAFGLVALDYSALIAVIEAM